VTSGAKTHVRSIDTAARVHWLCAKWNAHDHHQIAKSVPGPASQPTDLPIAEARANCNWCREAQEFGFQWHCCLPQSTHSLLETGAQSSCLVSSGGCPGRRSGLLRRFSVLVNVTLVCPSATPNESVRPSGQLTSEQARLNRVRVAIFVPQDYRHDDSRGLTQH
jgi:hypothetical protein